MKSVIGLISIEDFWCTQMFVINFKGKENIIPREAYYDVTTTMKLDLTLLHQQLVQTFKEHLLPGFNVCIDEIRIPARHFDCDLKKYNLKKPDVWAIESKSLHDSSSYLLDFVNPLDSPQKTPKEVVETFAGWLLTTGRKHHIVVDSNFLSALDVELFENKGLWMTAGCKSDRPSFLWKDTLAKNLPAGYTRMAKKGNVVAACTKNQGILKLASNYFSVDDNKQKYHPEDRRMIMKIYDANKSFADNFGHLVKAYWPDLKFRNWEMTLLVGWFMYSCTNSYILYKLRGGAESHRQFIFQIAAHLISSK